MIYSKPVSTRPRGHTGFQSGKYARVPASSNGTNTVPNEETWNDQVRRAKSTSAWKIGGEGIGAPNQGSTEVFWDALQPNDKTVTVDQRQIEDWLPYTHQNVEILVPTWGNQSLGLNEVLVTLQNASSTINNIQFGSQFGGAATTSFQPQEEKTLSALIEVRPDPGLARGLAKLNPFVTGIDGFTAIKDFVTTVPEGVRRQENTAKQLCTKAYKLVDGELVLITIDEVFAETGNSFVSSAFGNRNGFQNKDVILEFTLWFAGWTDLKMLLNGPPINLQFSGDIRIARTLEGARNQTGRLYKNPYDGDAAKIGLLTINNGFLGALPTIEPNHIIKFYVSRDMLTNNTMRLAKIITLN